MLYAMYYICSISLERRSPVGISEPICAGTQNLHERTRAWGGSSGEGSFSDADPGPAHLLPICTLTSRTLKRTPKINLLRKLLNHPSSKE